MHLPRAHLLKYCQFLQDGEGERMDLYFLRDRDGHEADFLLVRDGKPDRIIEAKLSDTKPAPGLLYFSQKLGLENSVQVVYDAEERKESRYADMVPAAEFLGRLK